MTSSGMAQHPDERRLARFAAGEPCSAELARHLAGCPSCRRGVALRDPSAIFGVLAALPAAGSAPEYPARLPLPRRRLRASRLRAGMFGAAALAAVAALVIVARAPRAADVRPAFEDASARFAVRVSSPSARVVTLVAPGGAGPVVALVVDEGLDL